MSLMNVVMPCLWLVGVTVHTTREGFEAGPGGMTALLLYCSIEGRKEARYRDDYSSNK